MFCLSLTSIILHGLLKKYAIKQTMETQLLTYSFGLTVLSNMQLFNKDLIEWAIILNCFTIDI